MENRADTPWWLWPTLLSLDAPLVALVWQDFVARCYPTALRPAGRAALALTVWAIYLLDRLLDTRAPRFSLDGMPHWFYRRRRRFATALLVGVTLADAVLVFFDLRPSVLLTGMWVAAGVVLYLVTFAWAHVSGLLKRISAALLFSCGVFVVAWADRPGSLGFLTAPALAFGALCFGNIELLGHWEDGRSGTASGVFLAALALISAVFGASAWYVAIAWSAAGLATVALFSRRLSGNTRRVLADAILLIPALAIWTLTL